MGATKRKVELVSELPPSLPRSTQIEHQTRISSRTDARMLSLLPSGLSIATAPSAQASVTTPAMGVASSSRVHVQ